jgi:two-component system CheB/CheR fusion protein
VRTNGDFTTTDVTIRPVAAPRQTPPSAAPATGRESSLLFLVVLEPSAMPEHHDAASAAALGEPSEGAVVDARIAALRDELRAKEEILATTGEELATANDELTASNEELQSVNEELQSTNEELETSKEELQSINEELSTVNAELQVKVTELSRANNDMNNLLAGTGIATVFVDHQLRILRFTPTVSEIIHLIPSDVGRPLAHIASNLVGYDRWLADTQSVLDTLVPKEVDVATTSGRAFAMRILPYRTLDNVIEGAVITFVDVTEAKRAGQELERAERAMRLNEQRMRVALRASSIAVFNQDADLAYTWIYAPDDERSAAERLGKTDADLLPADEAATVMAIKRHVLESGIGTRKQVWMTLQGERSLYDLTIEPLRSAQGKVIGITCASLDLNGRRQEPGSGST